MTSSQKSTISAFDKASRFYDNFFFNWYYHRVYQYLLKLLSTQTQLQPDWRILDIGCATGNWLKLLQRKNPELNLFGLDISPHMVALAQKKAPAADIRLGDAENLPFPDQFFYLISIIDTLHYIQNPEKLLAECQRTLKPSGYLLIYTPAIEYLISRCVLYLGKISTATEKNIRPLRYQEINHLVTATGLQLLDHRLIDLSPILMNYAKYWLFLFQKPPLNESRPAMLIKPTDVII